MVLKVSTYKLKLYITTAMSSVTVKSNDQLPIDGLNKIGISKDMLKNMPVQLVDSLKRGEITPIIQTSIVASNGQTVRLPLRLQVIRDAGSGTPSLLVYPTRSEMENSLLLSSKEVDAVKAGETISKELIVNGQSRQHLIQFDGRTNSLVHIPANELKLEEKFRELESINDIHLGTQQKEQIRTGKPVELKVGDEKVTVGVDLREPHAFKVIKGDMNEWRQKQLELYDIAHPEVMGYVQTERNRWEYKQVVDREKGVHQAQTMSNGMKV